MGNCPTTLNQMSQALNSVIIRCHVKVKGKVAPVLFFIAEHHAMKTYWVNGSTAPLIL